ncbi:MAG: PPOX class F420-dependent oxidoreductase [Actinomycetota bacterium]
MTTAVSAIVPDTHADLLTKPAFAHLATVGADGAPQVTPMWFGWDGDDLLFSTLKTRRKYTNARRDPRVTVSITDPDNPYRYLQVTGEAILEDDVSAELVAQLVQKYLGDGIYPWDEPGADRVTIRVRCRKVCAFG